MLIVMPHSLLHGLNITIRAMGTVHEHTIMYVLSVDIAPILLVNM